MVCYTDPETLSIMTYYLPVPVLIESSYIFLPFELYPEHLFFKLMLSLKNSPDVGRWKARNMEYTILNNYYLYHLILNNATVSYHWSYVLDTICLTLYTSCACEIVLYNTINVFVHKVEYVTTSKFKVLLKHQTSHKQNKE